MCDLAKPSVQVNTAALDYAKVCDLANPSVQVNTAALD